MNSWLLPCLLSTLASSALAQKTTNVAWDAFVREHGTEWAVEWSPATGTPTAIYGQGLSLPGRTANLADARRRSEQTLERYAALLGRGASKFVEITGEPAMRLYVFVYKQEFKGLQVIDGRADVRVHANGGISMFGAEAIPVPADFNVVPTLTLAKAHKAAGRHLSLANLHAPNEPKAADRLVVWSDVGQRVPVAPRLAWDIDVGVPSVNKVGRAYIDAHTGALLEYRNEILNCCKRLREAVLTPTTQPEAAESGEFYVKVIPDPSAPTNGATVDGTISAWSINDLDPYAGLTLMPMPHFKIGTTFTDASGKFSLPGNSVTVTLRFAGKHIGKVTASSGVTFSKTLTLSGSNNKIVIYTQAAPEYDRSQSTAFLYVTRCNLFMRNYMTSKSGLDKLNTFTADVNVGGSCNAFYQNNNARFYRKSGTCPNMAYSSI
ncbi:MAG: hypothetical protein QGG14_06580, partial [Planctomycetota bacterium]|nr:hypothetical protein [Planctomycetota bacterium]